MTTQAQALQTISLYESYVKVDPKNRLLWLELGDLYHKVSRLDEAVRAYEEYLTLAPEDSVARSRIASIRISQHRFPEAEEILRGLLDAEGSNAALTYNLGISLYYQERWEPARQAFEKALALGAEAPACLAYITRCLHHEGKLDEALEQGRKWSEAANTPVAKGYLSLLELDKGNTAEAKRLALEVLSVAPDNSDAAVVAGNAAIEEQDIGAAESHFASVLQAQPNHPRALFGGGLVRLYKQDHDQALATLERAAKMMPKYLGIRIAIGWAKILKRDLKGAEETFREVIAINRNFAEGHGGLAYVLALRGNIDEANREVQAAMWLDPTSFGALAARSAILGMQGKQERSVNLVAAMLEQPLAPGQPPLIEHVKDYLVKQGKLPANLPSDKDKPS